MTDRRLNCRRFCVLVGGSVTDDQAARFSGAEARQERQICVRRPERPTNCSTSRPQILHFTALG